MRFELRGTEALTIELKGTLDVAEARELAGAARLDFELDPEGRVVVGLLLFDMRGLGARGLPGPRFDYREALWRLGVVRDGAPSWLGVCCDIDHPIVRRTGALLVRYPVREASFVFEDWTARVEAREGSLQVTARPAADEAPVVAPRPTFVRAGEQLYRIPWREEPAPFRRHASASVSGALGATTMGGSLRWEPAAMVHRGRVHRCGLAARVDR